MRSPNRLITYEHTHNYCYHLDRQRISLSRSRLELSHGPWFHWERPFLDAIPCPMARLRTAGRKCDSSLVLVLEHCRKRPHVHLLHFPARSGWHPGVSAELDDLHSQFDADQETQICLHGCRAFSKTARNGIANDQSPE